MISEWDTYWKKQNAQVREYVRKGIPVHFRGIAWQLLCSATEAPEKKLYAEYIKVIKISLNASAFMTGLVYCDINFPDQIAV